MYLPTNLETVFGVMLTREFEALHVWRDIMDESDIQRDTVSSYKGRINMLLDLRGAVQAS